MRGVLFDIDHTLVDTAAAFEAALGASLLPLLPPDADPIALALQWGHDAGGWYRAYTRGELGYLAQRRRRMDEVLLDHGGAALDDAGFARATELFDRAFAASWHPFPDAVEIVARLAAAGVPLGAVSNAGGAMQRCKLAAVGFATLVPLLVTMDTFGVGKPDPRVFVEGARLLGVQPDEVAYVGDEPDIDADAATRAGLVGCICAGRVTSVSVPARLTSENTSRWETSQPSRTFSLCPARGAPDRVLPRYGLDARRTPVLEHHG